MGRPKAIPRQRSRTLSQPGIAKQRSSSECGTRKTKWARLDTGRKRFEARCRFFEDDTRELSGSYRE